MAPGTKAPRCRRPAHLHRGVHPAEAVPHRYTAVVSRYRAAVVERRHKGQRPAAVATYHRALRRAVAVLQAAVPVRRSSLRPGGGRLAST